MWNCINRHCRYLIHDFCISYQCHFHNLCINPQVCIMQEHRFNVQFPLHWRLTISRIASGAGGTSVVMGWAAYLYCPWSTRSLWGPTVYVGKLKPSPILWLEHAPLVTFFKGSKRRWQLVTFYHIFTKQMPTLLWDVWELDAFRVICSADKLWQVQQ